MTEKQVAAKRLTIGLIPKGVDDLTRLRFLTGLSKTAIVNRAVQVYAFVQRELEAGNDLLVRDSEGNVDKIRLL